jgi:hypothetical protein
MGNSHPSSQTDPRLNYIANQLDHCGYETAHVHENIAANVSSIGSGALCGANDTHNVNNRCNNSVNQNRSKGSNVKNSDSKNSGVGEKNGRGTDGGRWRGRRRRGRRKRLGEEGYALSAEDKSLVDSNGSDDESGSDFGTGSDYGESSCSSDSSDSGDYSDYEFEHFENQVRRSIQNANSAELNEREVLISEGLYEGKIGSVSAYDTAEDNPRNKFQQNYGPHSYGSGINSNRRSRYHDNLSSYALVEKNDSTDQTSFVGLGCGAPVDCSNQSTDGQVGGSMQEEGEGDTAWFPLKKGLLSGCTVMESASTAATQSANATIAARKGLIGAKSDSGAETNSTTAGESNAPTNPDTTNTRNANATTNTTTSVPQKPASSKDSTSLRTSPSKSPSQSKHTPLNSPTESPTETLLDSESPTEDHQVDAEQLLAEKKRKRRARREARREERRARREDRREERRELRRLAVLSQGRGIRAVDVLFNSTRWEAPNVVCSAAGDVVVW